MRNESVLEQDVTIVNQMGLHTRPAAQLAKIASEFDASLHLEKLDGSGEETDCSSILGLLMLAAGQGTKLRVSVSGPDREAALKVVCDYFNSGFGEEQEL